MEKVTAVQIDRSSYVPIYVQIQEDLRRLIQAQEDGGAPFYSDDELSKMYGVNRLTVRRAVEKLVDEGYLYRVRGVGTFVRSPKIHLETTASYMGSFEEQCRQAGKVCVVRVTRFERSTAPEQVEKLFGAAPGSQFCYLERVRFVDDIPMVIDKFYFPSEVYGGIAPEVCAELKMAEIYAAAVKRRPSLETIEAEAVLARQEDAGKLGITESDPLLMRRITVFLEDGSVAVTGKTLNRGDLFNLIIQIPLGGT